MAKKDDIPDIYAGTREDIKNAAGAVGSVTPTQMGSALHGIPGQVGGAAVDWANRMGNRVGAAGHYLLDPYAQVLKTAVTGDTSSVNAPVAPAQQPTALSSRGQTAPHVNTDAENAALSANTNLRQQWEAMNPDEVRNKAYIDEVIARGQQPAQAIPSAAPSAPYDPVAQLARLREIDPEKYGAAPSTGYFNNPAMNAGQGNNIEIPSDLGTLSPGQLASLVARVGLQKHATAQQATQALEGTRQQGAQALESMRERGAISRSQADIEGRRALAGEERAFKAPEQAAQIGALGAASEYHKTQSDVARASASNTFRIASARKIVDDTTGKFDAAQKSEARAFLEGEAKRAADEKNREVLYKWQLDNPGVDYRTGKQTESHANGGEVRGFADGGSISGSGAIGHSQTGQLHPLVSQYGQYLTAAAQTGVAPVPFAQYINLLGSTRGAMQQTPSQFADGGDVSALNRPLEGPGTGRSDSIPAVIDGKEPAALSKGEFVMDEATTKYYGTKFLKGLQQKAKEAMAEGQDHPTSKSGFADGGAVAAGATDAPENQQRDAQGYSMSTFNAKTGGYDAVLKPSTSAAPVTTASTTPVQTFSTSADSALPTRAPSQTSGIVTLGSIGHNPAQAAGSGPQYANPPMASGASMDDQRSSFLSGIRDSGITPGLGNRAWFADGSVKPKIGQDTSRTPYWTTGAA